MWRGFIHFLKKDFRLMLSGKFFILAFASLILYSCYINFIYVNMDQEIYPVYLYDPQGRQAAVSKYMIPLDDREDFEKAVRTNILSASTFPPANRNYTCWHPASILSTITASYGPRQY